MTKDLDVIRQAILNEEEGTAFYSMAAEKTSDETLKEAYSHLMNEELQHGKWLRSLYERLLLKEASANSEWDTLEEIMFNKNAEMRKQGKSPGLFTQADAKFEIAITDMAVFAAGALMEQASIDFYTKASSETKSEEAKKLYDVLVEWEDIHLNELNSIHEGLMKIWLDKYEFTYSPKL